MVDYKEQTIQGEIKKWRRANEVIIKNPYGLVPSMIFNLEDVTKLPNGETSFKPVGSFVCKYENPDYEFDLIHPITGEVVGKGNDGWLHLFLYSKFMDEAKKNDAPKVKDERVK